MNRRGFIPTVEGNTLESRLVLSGGAKSALVRVLGAPTDPSIPFVVAPPGVSQASINFTTLRASQVLHGFVVNGKYYPGMNRLYDRFIITDNPKPIVAALRVIAAKIPYGRQNLLTTWYAEIGALTASEAKQLALQDYVDYLRANVGLTFNYLVSRGHPNEFGIPTNGTVGKT